MSPLADAVRFVNRDETEAGLCQQRRERLAALARDPLRRHIQKPVAPLADAGRHRRTLVERLGAVQIGSRHAVGDERVDLILHQRDER